MDAGIYFLNEMKEADLIGYHHNTHLTTDLDSKLMPAPIVRKIIHNTSHPHQSYDLVALFRYFGKTEPSESNVSLLTYSMCVSLATMTWLPASFPSPRKAGPDD